MILPDHVLLCLNRLEEQGYSAWAVGGCVRDSLLGLTPHDYDLCTQALPEELQQVFADFPLVLAGVKHGTVGVVTPGGVVEITTYRREGSYSDNRHPDAVFFVPDVREDLARRDFTVNAMAYSPRRGLADPWGGQEDLRQEILRAVGDPEQRFREDALRILRGVRFAVRFGLTPEPNTLAAMEHLTPLLEHLARERVYAELSGLLPLVRAEDLHRYAPILAQVIPELRPAFGFDQRSPHHAYDLFTHIAYVTAGVGPDLALRWAALLHDIGKVPTFTRDENGRGHFYGHAEVGANMADAILRRLKAPSALREEAVALIRRHMLRLEPNKKQLRRQVSKLGWAFVYKLLALQEADMSSKGTGTSADTEPFQAIRAMLEELKAEDCAFTLKDLAVNGRDLMALGFQGKAVGDALNALLEQVLDERLPNESAALLEAAGTWREKQ